jgi:hypothetical protein
VTPIITGTMIAHFIFHIHRISVLGSLHFYLFSDSFCITFLSIVIAMSISSHILSVLFLIIVSGLLARTYLFVPLDSIVLLYFYVHILP